MTEDQRDFENDNMRKADVYKIHIRYILIISVILIAGTVCVANQGNSELNTVLSLAATVTSILLSCVAIWLCVIKEHTSNTVQRKIYDAVEKLSGEASKTPLQSVANETVKQDLTLQAEALEKYHTLYQKCEELIARLESANVEIAATSVEDNIEESSIDKKNLNQDTSETSDEDVSSSIESGNEVVETVSEAESETESITDIIPKLFAADRNSLSEAMKGQAGSLVIYTKMKGILDQTILAEKFEKAAEYYISVKDLPLEVVVRSFDNFVKELEIENSTYVASVVLPILICMDVVRLFDDDNVKGYIAERIKEANEVK